MGEIHVRRQALKQKGKIILRMFDVAVLSPYSIDGCVIVFSASSRGYNRT